MAGPKRRVLGIVAVPHTRTSVTSISLHVGQLFTTESLSEVQVKVSVIEGTGGEVYHWVLGLVWGSRRERKGWFYKSSEAASSSGVAAKLSHTSHHPTGTRNRKEDTLTGFSNSNSCDVTIREVT